MKMYKQPIFLLLFFVSCNNTKPSEKTQPQQANSKDVTVKSINDRDSCITYYKQDTIIYIQDCYRSGVLISSEEYYPNGLLKLRKEISSDSSYTIKTWWSNGNMLGKSSFFFNGIEIDTHEVYYWNGNIKERGVYDPLSEEEIQNLNLFSRKTSQDGVIYRREKDGKWKYWDENGRLIKEEIFENGISVFKKEYGNTSK